MTDYKTNDYKTVFQGGTMHENNFNPKNLYIIGAIGALTQLAAILALIVVQATLGGTPDGPEAYYALYQQSPLIMLLRGDVLLLVLLGGYLGVFPALYVALKRSSPVAVFYATLLTLMGVIGFFVTESTFALYHLAGQYAAATGEALRAQLIAAGHAVLAANHWHSSGAYMNGILAQGSGVIISLVMLRSRDFSKVTAISGLVGNAVDLVQHLLHPFAPSIAAPIQMVMGIFYFVWFPMLARDFFRLAKVTRQP
jgi:hypothetical protein